MLRRKLLPGPVLLGFAEQFDATWGDGKTPWPYPQVTPSTMSGILLPFRCPHCGQVCPEMVDPAVRDRYFDPARGFSFCPACCKRYVINWRGMPLAEALPAGAVSAPAKVERGGKVETMTARPKGSLELLGATRSM